MLHTGLQVDQSVQICYDQVVTTGLNDGCSEREPTRINHGIIGSFRG